MTRLVDAYEDIRARAAELRREREQALNNAGSDLADAPAPGQPDAVLAGDVEAEMLHALFPDAQKAEAHAEAIGEYHPAPVWDRAYWGPDVELRGSGPEDWFVTNLIFGYSFGPFDLPGAIAVARRLRALSERGGTLKSGYARC